MGAERRRNLARVATGLAPPQEDNAEGEMVAVAAVEIVRGLEAATAATAGQAVMVG